MKRSDLVADGRQRALAGAADHLAPFRRQVEQEVAARYAPQLASAGRFRRLVLRLRMAQQVRRRVRQEIRRFAPWNALYFGRYIGTPAVSQPASNESCGGGNPRQFSLRALLWFVLACSVWFSQFALIASQSRQGFNAPTTAPTVIVAWLVLAVFYAYRRQRLSGALFVHAFGPGVLVLPLLLWLFGPPSDGELLGPVLLVGMFFSNLWSFPVAVLTLLDRALRRPSPTRRAGPIFPDSTRFW